MSVAMVTNNDMFRNNDYLIDSYLSLKKSEGTKRIYNMELRKFEEWVRKPLIEVSKLDLLEYQKHVKETYNNEKTRQRLFTTIRNFYKWLCEMEWLSSNPAKGSLPKLTPKKSSPTDKILTEEEVISLINAASNNPRDYALIVLLAGTGLRINEALPMKWSDIMQNSKKGYVAHVIRKGGIEAYVPLRYDVVDTLMAYKKWARVNDDNTPVFFVLYRKEIKPMTDTQVRKILQKYAGIVGIDKEVTPHWLRHTYASHTLANGAGISDVQRDLGHSSPQITEIYLHPTRESANKYYPVSLAPTGMNIEARERNKHAIQKAKR